MSSPKKSASESAVLPTILTIIALGLAASLAAFYPLSMVALYIGILPVVLLLLWIGRDVEAPIDRILARDAERAAMRPAPREAKPLDRAA